MILHELSVGGVYFAVTRPGTWDALIASEVIEQDHYGLRQLAEDGVYLACCVDVGAHIGAFPLRIKQLWPDCRVICYEADPRNYALMAANVAHLENVEVFQAAMIGSCKQDVGLQSSEGGNTGGGRMSSMGTLLIRTLTLEHALMLVDHIDLLKLDCEGSEVAIMEWAAANDALKRIRLIRGEYHMHSDLGDVEGRLRTALEATHDLTRMERRRDDGNLGFFQAERNGDP